MAKPVIITVDDEPQVLNAVNRDLRQHYKGEYRIIRAGSGEEALEAVRQLKQRNEMVALLLSDQRMPGMTGTQFLSEARKFYPQARKVLLTAYADTSAAIDSINTIGLDYYLMKPWDPPEQHLYPVLDDLLGDWWTTVPVPFEGIRVVGTLWSATCHTVKDFLSRNRIPYQWLDIEQNEEARTLIETLGKEHPALPVIFLPHGEVLENPDLPALAEKVGLKTQASQPYYDLIIVGGGPAGLGAAVYGASEGLKTLLVEKEATGGQAGTSSRIENYLGFPQGLSGAELAQRATIQATRLGTEILTAQEVVSVRVDDPYKYVQLSNGAKLSCKGLIIATGVSVKMLNVPGIESLTGAGVYYGAALTEAANYRDQHVLVVGGANSAGQGAMFFSRYASTVTMLVRASVLELGMSQYLVDQIAATPNIEVLTRTVVESVRGTNKLEGVTYRKTDTGETYSVDTTAIFIFIGAVPHTEWVKGVVEMNSAGFILTGPDLMQNGKHPKNWKLRRDPFLLETSVPGIFAAGDARAGSTKRVANAVGEGAVCVRFVHQYLKEV
ncbi:MAG TPA: FAD-dependent oxidoreductase [Anaerolineales bacterium]|jgi:thioredoxin reductase (NADPH)|nr:FAD-dependent oxidoreductase [Anaerolineales bacterium]